MTMEILLASILQVLATGRPAITSTRSRGSLNTWVTSALNSHDGACCSLGTLDTW
jgi:hypothetical protein